MGSARSRSPYAAPTLAGPGTAHRERSESAPGSATRTRGAAVTHSPAERRAMARALELAQTLGVPLGPNPRVGCVLLDPDGTVVAEGYHRGAGTPHAEVDALTRGGLRARGTTAVVTLEPCNHTGRTGPCSRALVEAGVARVVYAQSDTEPGRRRRRTRRCGPPASTSSRG